MLLQAFSCWEFEFCGISKPLNGFGSRREVQASVFENQ